MEDTRILVTGAAGQLGSLLCIALQQKYGVKNVVRSDIKLVSGKVDILLDVTDVDAIKTVIHNHDINEVYHLAAILSANGEKNPILTWKVNMDGWLNILETSRKSNINKIFYPSSIAVYGNNSPLSETDQFGYQDPSTIYGITKSAGEYWAQYYFEKYGIDIRSLRYPGLISVDSKAGGGTTDYAVEIFDYVKKDGVYECFLSAETRLPMLYMDDAISATIQLMEAPKEAIKIRTSYNLVGMDFTPEELLNEIQKYEPSFSIKYFPDHRQAIADSWPNSINDEHAAADWGWNPYFTIEEMVSEIMQKLSIKKDNAK